MSDVLFIDTIYRPGPGSFSRPKKIENDRYKVEHWHYCRELFHGQLYNLSLFFFSHNSNKCNAIVSFMTKIEDMLDVQPRSSYGPTQRKTIMWVKPSRWWTVKTMRRSLFTILLRAACYYSPNKDNFEEALYSDPYTIATKYAVNRFLAGNTIYTGKKRGWYRQFYESKPTEEQINNLLVATI